MSNYQYKSQEQRLQETLLKNRRHALKIEIGSWMFALMSQLSQSEYLYLFKAMDTDPKLQTFKLRIDTARKAYRDFQEIATAEGYPHIGKAFYHGLTFIDDPENGPTIVFQLDSFHQKTAQVRAKIADKRAFAIFCNTISDSLPPSTDFDPKIQDCINSDELVFQDALSLNQDYFEEQRRLKEEKKAHAEKEKLEITTKASSQMPDTISPNDAQAMDMIGLDYNTINNADDEN